MAATWKQHNWFRHSILISEDRDYFIQQAVCLIWVNCWREFVGEFIPLLENWLRTTQNEVSMLPAETANCLKELHKTCDFMYDDIQTLLSYSQVNKYLNEIAKYLKDYSIIKYLRKEDCYDRNVYRTCNRLKK